MTSVKCKSGDGIPTGCQVGSCMFYCGYYVKADKILDYKPFYCYRLSDEYTLIIICCVCIELYKVYSMPAYVAVVHESCGPVSAIESPVSRLLCSVRTTVKGPKAPSSLV
jgi:hypothetical protein